MLAHTFNTSIWEAKEGGSLWIWGQTDLQRERQDTQGYTEENLSQLRPPQKDFYCTCVSILPASACMYVHHMYA